MTHAPDNQLCPCCSEQPYESCCKPYITRKSQAPTPEALMRSRYTAYTIHDVDYILDTMKGKALKIVDRTATKQWAENSKWLKLEVLQASALKPDENEGFVEFVAHFTENGTPKTLHELSRFTREQNRWYYVDGKYPGNKTVKHQQKIGRNDPCSCGSGKKYKKCCAS